ncbi:MAG: CHASE3 domain-containing protein [Rhizomicrobium sp.]
MQANRWILLAAVPVFLVLAGVLYVTIGFAQGEREQQSWVVHTYQVMDSLRAVLADAADSETGERGYLLTHKPGYLQPFRAAKLRTTRDLDAFEQLSRDNPDQQRRARTLRALVEGRLLLLDRAIAGSAGTATVPASLVALMDRGKADMDMVRTIVAAGLGEEQRLLEERVQARRAVERAEIIAASVAVVLALVVLLIAAGMLVRNNTRLVVSEAIRRRQAAILQATLDNIRDGILVFDESDRVAAFNNVFLRMMDFPERLAAIGATLDAFRKVDDGLARRMFDELPISAPGEETRYERFRRKEREIDVYRASVPGTGFLVAAADVTARVRAETTLRQAQKMEAVGHLTGGVAHDFNNLLQIISANLDLAAADARSDPKTAERLQNAISAVERGSRLTGQLLAFARRQALDPRSTNLGRLLRDMTDLLRRTLGERIEVESIVSGGLWNTLVDPSQVENAILNLAINARDAMADGGKLTIEIANAFLDETYAAQHTEVTAGQYVMLAVSDTGAGMSPEIMARVFDPFFTTKPEGKGTGAWPQPGLRLRQAVRRPCEALQRAGPGHDGEDLPAAYAPAAGGHRSRRHDGNHRRPRDDPGGGGRRGRTRRGGRYPERPRLRRAEGGKRRAGAHRARQRRQDRPAVHRRGDARIDQHARLRAAGTGDAPPASKCSSPRAIRRTRSCTMAGWTTTRTCSASPIARTSWRASCAACSTARRKRRPPRRSSPSAAARSRRGGARCWWSRTCR